MVGVCHGANCKCLCPGLMSSVVKEASEHLSPRRLQPKRAFLKEPCTSTGSACLLLSALSQSCLRSWTVACPKPIMGRKEGAGCD